MQQEYKIVVERDSETGLYVGYVPGIHGAHSQGETVGELRTNMAEVLAMILEDGDVIAESEFVGTESVLV